MTELVVFGRLLPEVQLFNMYEGDAKTSLWSLRPLRMRSAPAGAAAHCQHIQGTIRSRYTTRTVMLESWDYRMKQPHVAYNVVR